MVPMVSLPDGFVSLGWHQPADARRLLESLTEAGIRVHAEFDDGITGRSPLEAPLGGFGASASVLVAVEGARFADGEVILRETFGAWLPVELERESEGDAQDAEPETEFDGDAEAAFVRRLAREEWLADEIARLRRSLAELNAEIGAVEEEIAHVRTPEDRRQILRQALERHFLRAGEELAEVDRLNVELRGLRKGHE